MKLEHATNTQTDRHCSNFVILDNFCHGIQNIHSSKSNNSGNVQVFLLDPTQDKIKL